MQRKDRMRSGLADALDLTGICLEAGLSVEQAMLRVSNDLRLAHPDLANEFYLVSRAMYRHMPWDEAFCNLSGAHGRPRSNARRSERPLKPRTSTALAF